VLWDEHGVFYNTKKVNHLRRFLLANLEKITVKHSAKQP
jgi:hypothetical protein